MTNRTIQHYGESGSFKVGDLPDGCKKCLQGAKLVVYATGSCNVGCYYCTIPLSERKSDNIAINEKKLSPSDEVIRVMVEESELCLAKGIGITGGDPLLKPDRTLGYIRQMKDTFGDDYHVHLYTSGKYLTEQLLSELVDAGLDEIRLHPKHITARPIWEKASTAKSAYPGLIVGFEVPAIPNLEQELIELIKFADSSNIDFVNLNEFEFTEANFSRLETRGFVSVLHNAAVKDSATTALDVISKVKDNTSISIHFCSSGSKDAIQLTQRYKRRASQIARPFESISDEGELEYGRFETASPDDLGTLVGLLSDTYEVPSDLMVINTDTNSVETSWLIVDELVSQLREVLPGLKAEIICRHPVDDGPITWIDPV